MEKGGRARNVVSARATGAGDGPGLHAQARSAGGADELEVYMALCETKLGKKEGKAPALSSSLTNYLSPHPPPLLLMLLPKPHQHR